MDEAVRIIQVGLGPWGRNWAKNVVPEVAGVEAVAWVDPSPNARSQAIAELSIPTDRCFATLEEAAAAVPAEGVLGTVALAAHAEVADACIALGKHLLIEKPFTPTAAAQAGLVLNVSQNYRFYPAVTKAMALVGAGDLGPLLTADIAFH